MKQTLKDYSVSIGTVTPFNTPAPNISTFATTSYVTMSQEVILLSHVSTNHQLADNFIKPFDETRFVELRNELGILDPKNLD
jgi:hypothetical protein